MAIDPHQLAELWRQYASTLRLLARTRCDVAEDCVQEAFVRLATQVPIPTDPAAWLVTVVRNAAIDRARSDSCRKNREQSTARQSSSWFTIPEDAANEIPTESVQQALQELDDESREIVVAHLWGGLSFRQISVVFKISSSAAHRRYSDSLSQLRAILIERQHKS